MIDVQAYDSFLRKKIAIAPSRGVTVKKSDNPQLKPLTQVMARWAVEGGCRLVAGAFGLHKTCTQLEVMRHFGPERHRLIVIPLGVRLEFMDDASKYFDGDCHLDVRFIQSTSQVGSSSAIYLTNYESIRDGKLDVTLFDVISLDEGSCLRSFGSKTFSEFLFGPMQQVPYRFVFTATPSPNEFLELIAYAHFLGIMDMGEAKTRFFKRDSEHADRLTLHPHKEREFWLWVATWALFVQSPSDLGFSDEGYALPPLNVVWHEIPSIHTPEGPTREQRQGKLIRSSAIGVGNAAKEKKASLQYRIEKLLEIRAQDPDAHRVIWHDLEDERKAIERAIPGIASVYGSQDLAAREQLIIGFRNGEITELAGKPSMLGSGCNFQKHCHTAVFLGIGFKFNDFIQAIYRLQRFGQKHPVTVHLIYTEAEQEIRAQLERKWRQDTLQRATMREIIREFGLSTAALASELQRSFGCTRNIEEGENWKSVNDDNVAYTAELPDDSEHMICTSIPFSGQYEYSASYNDFGHTDDEDHFFEQMDFLTPELLRVTQPGRIAAIHVKDRVVPGAITGLGYQTVSPFMATTLLHFKKHGWSYMGAITVVTDVVRENAQTYRLSWSEQCKDGTRMGNGMPEYVLVFRKPPSDPSNGYADVPVTKTKEEYSRGRWQIDAHGFWRSNGNRLLLPEDLRGKRRDHIFKLFKADSQSTEYDHERTVALAEFLDQAGVLPPDFMLLQPWSHHEDVWSDVVRMLSLNSRQSQRRLEKHLCPFPFDIVDRLINRFTNPGERVYDPFGGFGTTGIRAAKLGRFGHTCELNLGYWRDGLFYYREVGAFVPALFDALDLEGEAA